MPNADNEQNFLWIGLGIGRISGEASGETRGGWLNRFSFPLSFLVDALFLLCPWFSHQVFYTVMGFNEASEVTGFFNVFLFCCCLLQYWQFPFLFLSFLCQNDGRPQMTDRIDTSGDDSCPAPQAPARETVFRPFPADESLRPRCIKRERSAFHYVSSIEFTLIMSIDPYIPTVWSWLRKTP